MISVYRVFQLIFGAFASFLIIYFFLHYTGNYAGLQEDTLRIEILKSLREEAKDVYFSGIPVVFNHTKRFDFSSCYINSTETLPKIHCDEFISGVRVITPLFFYVNGKKSLVLERRFLDYGWWKFYFVEAIPEMEFVFNPLDSSQETWNIMKEIVEILPDNPDGTVRITFDFCDGKPVRACGGKTCEKDDFLSILELPHNYLFSSCSVKPGKNQRIVTISKSCNGIQGICITPPDSNGLGYVYTPRASRPYLYKDPLDILSLIIPGDAEDILGISLGKRMYEYKNNLLLSRLTMVSKSMGKRYILTAREFQKLALKATNPEQKNKLQYCSQKYTELANLLESISNLPKDFTNFQYMSLLNQKLSRTKSMYENLVNEGCEYEV